MKISRQRVQTGLSSADGIVSMPGSMPREGRVNSPNIFLKE